MIIKDQEVINAPGQKQFAPWEQLQQLVQHQPCRGKREGEGKGKGRKRKSVRRL